MKYKIERRTNTKEFKTAPRNPLDIPTGQLDKPLTNGYEVYQFIMEKCRLTARYKFRGRPRGKGWYDSMPLEDAERIALYIDEKPDYSSKVKAERDRLGDLQEVKDTFNNFNNAVSYYENVHGEEIDIRYNNK